MVADFSWIAEVEKLSPAALTVLAQTLSPTDNGKMRWAEFFPRVNVDSVNLRDMFTLDDRPAADRREWNARGRFIPVLTPAQRLMSIVPIEGYDKIDELEMQRLKEGAFGAQQVVIDQIGVRIPARVERIAMAVYRRLELDAFKAWATGTIIQKNPQKGNTFTASFGFDAARYTTASPTWVAAANAFDAFLAFLEDAQEAVGPIEGAVMRLATFREILEDAPDLSGGVPMTKMQLADRIQQDLGTPFRFEVMENTIDEFTDGGIDTTPTKVWTAEQVAVIPAGGIVGRSAFAPVSRAMDLAAQVPEAKIDINGVSVFYESSNGGRELAIEEQINAMPIPQESKLFVTDAGV
jgi:hypothetical protein